MKYIIILIGISYFLAGCKNSTTNNSVNSEKQTQELSFSVPELPPASEEFIFDLYDRVDHIDYLFRNTNFSISQSEKEAVQATVSTLSPSPARAVGNHCQSPIRMTYLSNGEIICDTEMYMTNNCQYVEYYIDGKKTFQNNYSQEGYNFLIGLINQAKNAKPQ